MAQQKTNIAAYLSELEPEFLTAERFSWWAMAVFDFCEELGIDDDPDLPEMQKQIRNYYVSRKKQLNGYNNLLENEAEVGQMRQTIRRLRGDGFLQDESLLGIKYRCLYAIASPIEEIERNRTRYITSLAETFRTIGLRMGGEQAVVERIKRRTGSLRALLADEDGAETYVWVDEYPLHDAAFLGDLERVLHCLDGGVPVDTIDRIGATALFYAAMEDRTAVAHYLIDHSANVNAVTSSRHYSTYGMTPLQMATHGASPEMVRLLLEHGADTSVLSRRGLTPLESLTSRYNSPHRSADDEIKIKLLRQYQRPPRLDNFGFTIRRYDTADVIARLRTNSLANYELRPQNLSYAWLAGEDLRGANLQGCDLSFANLAEADLRGTNLFRANLSKAILDGANLSGADLRYATLSEAYMQSAIFDEADMTDAKVDNAAMHGMSIRGTRFLVRGLEHRYETQYGTYRHQPILKDVVFTKETVAPPNFSLLDYGARMTDETNPVPWDRPQFAIRNEASSKVMLVLESNNLAGYDFRGINLHHAWLAGKDLRGCNFQWCDMRNAVLSYADLTGADLSHASLVNAKASGANFSKATLRSTLLMAIDLRLAIFDGADMTGADITISVFYGASLKGTKFLVNGLEQLNEANIGNVVADYPDQPPMDRAVFTPSTAVTPGLALTDFGATLVEETV